MARPQKNSCDYFPHDKDMRNHRKVRSIRNKFGIQGYAIWSMLIEYLTGVDGNEFEYSDMEFELISGDFGVSVTEIREVVDYCIKMEMLFNSNGFVYSDSLNKRLEPVYKKRGAAKEISEKQKRIKGKFYKSTVVSVVSVAETPQSKVNKSKVNKINTSIDVKKEDELEISKNDSEPVPDFVSANRKKITPLVGGGRLDQKSLKSDLMENDYCNMQASRDGILKGEYEFAVDFFIEQKFGLGENDKWKDLADARRNFTNWIPYYITNKQKVTNGNTNENPRIINFDQNGNAILGVGFSNSGNGQDGKSSNRIIAIGKRPSISKHG